MWLTIPKPSWARSLITFWVKKWEKTCQKKIKFQFRMTYFPLWSICTTPSTTLEAKLHIISSSPMSSRLFKIRPWSLKSSPCFKTQICPSSLTLNRKLLLKISSSTSIRKGFPPNRFTSRVPYMPRKCWLFYQKTIKLANLCSMSSYLPGCWLGISTKLPIPWVRIIQLSLNWSWSRI